MIALPGPVVSMCGIDDKLMVVYHSAPASEDQHLSAMLLQTIGGGEGEKWNLVGIFLLCSDL